MAVIYLICTLVFPADAWNLKGEEKNLISR
jgi:hypothetical protein